MPLALDRKPIIDMTSPLQLIKELSPHGLPLSCVEESFGISKKDQSIARSGQEDIQPFTLSQPTNITSWVVPYETSDHDL